MTTQMTPLFGDSPAERRVYVKPLGMWGTVDHVRGDGRIIVLADRTTQPLPWLPHEVSDDGPRREDS